MIPDRYSPIDSEQVRELDKCGLLDYADLNTPGVRRSLDRLLTNIKRDVVSDASFLKRFSKSASDRKKLRDGDKFGYQLLSYKASRLLYELKELGLAWQPDMPDGDNYLEMHPHMGEGIMSTMAVACAIDGGLGIVADEAPLHDCVLRHAEGELYSKLIKRRRSSPPQAFRADRCKIELLVFQQFDISKLTPKNIAKLREEREPLDLFRAQIAKVAESIPPMREEERFERKLKEEVASIIADWEKSKSKPGSLAKEIFTGSGRPGGSF